MTREEEQERKWWRNPQGLVAAATVATMVLGFFYVRERQMWEVSSKINSIERRGDSAILATSTRAERMEAFMGSLRDQVNFLERKIDRLETKIAEQEKYDATHP